jgi:hypothetical protein
MSSSRGDLADKPEDYASRIYGPNTNNVWQIVSRKRSVGRRIRNDAMTYWPTGLVSMEGYSRTEEDAAI